MLTCNPRMTFSFVRRFQRNQKKSTISDHALKLLTHIHSKERAIKWQNQNDYYRKVETGSLRAHEVV